MRKVFWRLGLEEGNELMIPGVLFSRHKKVFAWVYLEEGLFWEGFCVYCCCLTKVFDFSPAFAIAH